jgi:electron transport complex protein RnfB
MSRGEHIHKITERYLKADSAALHKIFECAVTDEEARFLLDLPAPKADLAARWGLSEQAIDDKLLDLARRGLVVTSRKGPRLPGDLTTLHDNMLASARDQIPTGMDTFWRELYDDEGWAIEIGTALSSLPERVLRTIPVQNSVPPGTTLLPHEDMVEIIQAHKDLISIRHCCCRTAAKKCDHPTQVCMQFGRRAEYDLYRSSGRKVSADEAIAIALQAGDSGLVPTVTNVSVLEGLEFICFCCGCCCLIINPGLRVKALDKILNPSRFVAKIDAELCNACGDCVQRCCVDAIQVQKDTVKAVIDRDRCLGCGACVSACPFEGGLTMELARPPEFIPESIFGPSVLVHM